MAIACFLQNVWFAVLMLLFLIIYLERIIATEEEFLTEKFGDAYRDWAAEVPAFFRADCPVGARQNCRSPSATC